MLFLTKYTPLFMSDLSIESSEHDHEVTSSATHLRLYLTIRLQARVFYEQIVNEAQPSWLSLVENEGE